MPGGCVARRAETLFRSSAACLENRVNKLNPGLAGASKALECDDAFFNNEPAPKKKHMKNPLILTLTLTLLAFLALPQVSRAQIRNLPSSPAADAAGLLENHTIRIWGSYGETLPLDLSVTGVGPAFSIQTAEPNISFQAIVTQQKDKLQISYTLSASVPFKTGANTSEYRSVNLSGTVRCDYDKPLSIATINQKKLEILIQKTPLEGKK